jgi:hypothetical protein
MGSPRPVPKDDHEENNRRHWLVHLGALSISQDRYTEMNREMSFMSKVSRFAARLTTLGVASAAATTLLFTGTASAATEQVCNTYYCNQTVGTGNYIQYVNASKKAPIAGTYGFFEVFGRGWKKLTSPRPPITGRSRSAGRSSWVNWFAFDTSRTIDPSGGHPAS